MNAAPRILTAAELLGLELPEPRWAVPELVPEGLTIFAGRPKLGKSWLMLATALAIASGGRALGSLDVEEGEVLYLALEDSARRLQDRIRTLLAGQAPPARLHLAREWPRADQQGIEHITLWLQQHETARMVVIDTLVRFRARRKGQRGYDDDSDDLEPLQQLALNRRCALVVVHHTRKTPGVDWIDDISGTLGLAGSADGLLALCRARGENKAELKITGRDIEERELGLRFDPHAGTWVLLGEAAETVALSDERQRLVAILRQLARPASARELANYTGKEYEATRKLLYRMAVDELVTSSRAGWSLAHARADTGVPTVPAEFNPGHPNGAHGPARDTRDTRDARDTPDRRDTQLAVLDRYVPVDLLPTCPVGHRDGYDLVDDQRVCATCGVAW